MGEQYGRMIARALTIAGSDSGGGAGIQADLKTFTVFGAYGMSAITALTAQNTCGVAGIHPVPPSFVKAQIDAVVSDIGVDAAKTGMLANAELVRVVAEAVRAWRIEPLVVDPVMIAQSGAALAEDEVADAVLRELLPLATLVTPNLHEAGRLSGLTVASVPDMHRAARRLLDAGARAVLVKGGHLDSGDAVDVFDDGRETHEFRSERLPALHTHGTGCQLSAAITAGLAGGLPLVHAIGRAKMFITDAIREGLAIGRGTGPANPLAWLQHRAARGRAPAAAD